MIWYQHSPHFYTMIFPEWLYTGRFGGYVQCWIHMYIQMNIWKSEYGVASVKIYGGRSSGFMGYTQAANSTESDGPALPSTYIQAYVCIYALSPYLIFVTLFTQPQFEALKFYTWKCVNLRQKLSRDKTASTGNWELKFTYYLCVKLSLCNIIHCV